MRISPQVYGMAPLEIHDDGTNTTFVVKAETYYGVANATKDFLVGGTGSVKERKLV